MNFKFQRHKDFFEETSEKSLDRIIYHHDFSLVYARKDRGPSDDCQFFAMLRYCPCQYIIQAASSALPDRILTVTMKFKIHEDRF